MKKIAMFGMLSVFLISLIASGAFAYQGDGNFDVNHEDQKAVMDEICETGVIPEDFDGPMSDDLESNFDAVCKMHDARVNGMNREDLHDLADELGLKRPMHGQEMHDQGLVNHEDQKAVMDEICETGVIPEDFDGPMYGQLESNFDAVCEMHDARVNAMNFEDLHDLADELGLKRPMKEHGRRSLGRNKMFS